jgi:type II secretory pathway pseudopilin PulG
MKYLACFRGLSPLRQTVPAFSIVEILVAMLILSILSVGAIQLLSDTETQLIEDFADQSKSQKK